MKLLLDEQMPRKIYRLFPSNFVVSNVQTEGWAGVQNGELLDLAHSRDFDALISADKNIAYQQYEFTLPISVVILYVSRLRIEELEPLIPKAVLQLNLKSCLLPLTSESASNKKHLSVASIVLRQIRKSQAFLAASNTGPDLTTRQAVLEHSEFVFKVKKEALGP